jgi:uncharacterized protein YqeY
MPIKKQIHQNMIQALKDRDRTSKTVWATLLSSLENEEKGSKTPHEFNDDEASAFLKEQIKQREKSAKAYNDVDSTDMADKELSEARMIRSLLPEIEVIREALKKKAIFLRAQAHNDIDNHSFGMVMKEIKSRDDLTSKNDVMLQEKKFSII